MSRIVLNQGVQVRLVIDGLFDGIAGRQSNALAFQAQGRARSGLVAATIDGQPCRLMVSRQTGQDRATTPWMDAAIQPD